MPDIKDRRVVVFNFRVANETYLVSITKTGDAAFTFAFFNTHTWTSSSTLCGVLVFDTMLMLSFLSPLLAVSLKVGPFIRR
jgi:hypothetical protein